MQQPNHTSSKIEEPDIFFEYGEWDSSILQRVHIDTAPVNTQITGDALMLRSDLRTDRSGRSYLTMTLQCAGSATVEARWWRYPHPSSASPVQGEVYRITDFVDVFNGERQLRVIHAQRIPAADLSAFVTSTRRALAELLRELDILCSTLDAQMRALVRAVLHDQILDDFCEWPAAHHRHGAVRHGLLAHSLRVAELVQRIADAYGIDGLTFDRSLALTAALLHDLGKLSTLPAIAGAAIPEIATYFDHVTLSVLAVQCAASRLDDPLPADRLDNLLHAILAHHGRKEWGAACEPHTVEAWLVHLADLAESRLWAYSNEENTAPHHPAELAQTGSESMPDTTIASSMLI
jgi:3'-5' exoribonuclease